MVESAARKDVTSSFVLVGTRLYQVVVAPVRMPAPAAWLFMGFRVDDALAAELKDVTALDVTFLASMHAALSTARPPSLKDRGAR